MKGRAGSALKARAQPLNLKTDPSKPAFTVRKRTGEELQLPLSDRLLSSSFNL